MQLYFPRLLQVPDKNLTELRHHLKFGPKLLPKAFLRSQLRGESSPIN